MLYVQVISSAIFAGYEAVTLVVGDRLPFMSRLASGISLGVAYQSFFVFILQYFISWGQTLAYISIFAFCALSLVLHLINATKTPVITIKYRTLDLLFVAIFSIFVIYRTNFIYFYHGSYTRGAAWGDFMFQTQLITSIATGCNMERKTLFDIRTPFLDGMPLAYPIFPSYNAALLFSSCGASLPQSTRPVAFLLMTSCIFLLHDFVFCFTKCNISAVISIPLWIFSGGLGFLIAFDHGLFIDASKYNYIHNIYNGIDSFWFNTLCNLLFPQKCALFSMPLDLTILICLFNGVEEFDWRFFLLAALAVGVLPQTQAHSYVSVAIFSIFLAVLSIPSDKKKAFKALKCWIIYGIIANLIAIPLMYPFIKRTLEGSSFLNFSPVWELESLVSNCTFKIFGLWWRALGPTGALALGPCLLTANKEQIRFFLASIPVLLVSMTIIFQKWETDNVKLLHASWFPIVVGTVSQYYVLLWKKYKSALLRSIIVILYISSTLSGIFALIVNERFDLSLYTDEIQIAGEWASENTAVYSKFENFELINPAANAAGRQIIYGFAGWEVNHGIENMTTKIALSNTNITDNFEDLKAYGATYFLRDKIQSYPEDYLSSRQRLEEVFFNGRFKIWRIL